MLRYRLMELKEEYRVALVPRVPHDRVSLNISLTSLIASSRTPSDMHQVRQP